MSPYINRSSAGTESAHSINESCRRTTSNACFLFKSKDWFVFFFSRLKIFQVIIMFVKYIRDKIVLNPIGEKCRVLSSLLSCQHVCINLADMVV